VTHVADAAVAVAAEFLLDWGAQCVHSESYMVVRFATWEVDLIDHFLDARQLTFRQRVFFWVAHAVSPARGHNGLSAS
jgi:hypothetical protein